MANMESLQKERRSLFYSNLLLLGFDSNAMEKKHSISFHKDMFHVSNKTAFEVVSYFLFSKLNDVTNDEFRIIWPVLDPKLAQEFRKTCYSHLTKISTENVDGVRFPRMYPSLLMTPCGERFYELYLAFSVYVMQRCIDEDNLYQRPIYVVLDNSKLSSVQEKSFKIFSICATETFIEVEEESSKQQELWEMTSENFLSFYKDTKQKMSQLSMDKKELLDILCKKYSVDETLNDESKLEQLILRKDESVDKILSSWKVLEELLNMEQLLWDNIHSELDSEQDEKLILDGQQYMIAMPDILKTDYKNDLIEKKVQCLVESGKLSVKNFTNLSAITIKCYGDLFKRDCLPETKYLMDVLKRNIEQLKVYLDKVKILNQKYLKIINQESDQLEKLEEVVYSSQNTDIPAEFLPFTPTFTFTPKRGRKSSVLPENYLLKTPNTNQKYSLSRRKQELNVVSPLPFNAFSISNTPGENHGHLSPSLDLLGINNVAQEKKCTTPEQDISNHDVNIHTGDLYLSCFSDEQTLHDDGTSTKSFDTINITHSFNKIEKVSDESRGSFISNESPPKDINDNKALSNSISTPSSNKICQTPVSEQSFFSAESLEKLSKFSDYLNPGNNLFNGKHYDFSNISISEELLDDIEMPEIPFY